MFLKYYRATFWERAFELFGGPTAQKRRRKPGTTKNKRQGVSKARRKMAQATRRQNRRR